MSKKAQDKQKKSLSKLQKLLESEGDEQSQNSDNLPILKKHESNISNVESLGGRKRGYSDIDHDNLAQFELNHDLSLKKELSRHF